MRATEKTYYNLKRLHVVFLIAAVALLGVSVWMVVTDARRPWKRYQRTYREEILPELAEARQQPLPAPGRLAVEQIWLPELTRDLHFRRVERFDRCVTCHQGIDRTWPDGAEKTAFRGGELPEPYCPHPRLSLYVGEQSPHPMSRFGCTICHEGQGSATDFRWASHAPNSAGQRQQWRTAYGWSRNPHWDFPMLPERFVESRCLQCHHAVTDLEPSDRFPEPPAPKLLTGYEQIRLNGCFSCHEIRGTDQEGRSIGPDLRLEPNYAEAALSLAANPTVPAAVQDVAKSFAQHPDDADARRELVARFVDEPLPELSTYGQRMVALLAKDDLPGTMRKVGSSLRDLGPRVADDYLVDWIANPTRFLPGTRMPQFFGLHRHLDEETKKRTARFEAVEIHAVVEYLRAVAEPIEPVAVPEAVTEPPSAERGRKLFATQGCLACHAHAAFPDSQGIQGPDLTRLAAKFTDPAGRRWLVSWIRDPHRHSPRTMQPNVQLTPEPLPTAKDRFTDPAADIAAFLIDEAGLYQFAPVRSVSEADLDTLAAEYLGKSYPGEQVEAILRDGLADDMAADAAADVLELRGKPSLGKKLRYVGRCTIRKRGCYGCHDIPGFEEAPLIGPALTDWGRKSETLLAFEQVHRFMQQQSQAAEAPAKEASPNDDSPEDRAFFRQAIEQQRREGFLWQKLRGPRSFDFEKARSKPFNSQLLMGRFGMDAPQREAVMTFVLGLIGERPAEPYVYSPGRRQQAIVDGRQVLAKYACAQCHTLGMQDWQFHFDPAEFEDPAPLDDFAFMRPRFSPEQLAASQQTDSQGFGSAEVIGRPQTGEQGELLVVDDDEDDAGNERLLYSFTLWQPAAINGQVWPAGGVDVLVWSDRLFAQREPNGGAFARWLHPFVLRDARASGTTPPGQEAWGWGPPPLVGEGAKVEPAWLHAYLLAPTRIRPAAVLNMPRYNVSSDEAAKLVDYFAAVAGASFPYADRSRQQAERLALLDQQQPDRVRDALRTVTDAKTYCAKCHLIGDYTPGISVAGNSTTTTLGPRLDRVGGRLRAEYLRRWLARPQASLPYSGMPVNFPPDEKPLDPSLFPGTSLEQLDAVADLLLNYSWYLKERDDQ